MREPPMDARVMLIGQQMSRPLQFSTLKAQLSGNLNL
jgi:hypothetical protein